MPRIAGSAALFGLAVLGALRAVTLIAHVRLGTAGEAWVILGMVACYAAVAACGRAVPDVPGWLVMAALLALFAAVPPAHRHDVFAYVAYARMGALHHVNPYLYGPGAIKGDPVTPYYDPMWRHLPSKYGPLFTLFSYVLVPLGVVGAAWALKLVTAAAAVGLLALVGVAAGRLGLDRGDAVRFVGLNPLLLVYAVGNAHNDVLMAVALAAGVAALAAGQYGSAGALGVVSAAIKPPSALALPFLVLGARSRARALAGAALAGAATLALTIAAFGLPLKLVKTLAGHENGSGRRSLLGLLGLPPHGAGRAVLLALFVAAYVVLLALAWRRRLSASTAAGWAMAATLALSTVVYEWYLVWLVPLAALSRSRRLRVAAVALTALVTLIWPARSLI